jgi:teichuronic acid biosynthesis protein TuaE
MVGLGASAPGLGLLVAVALASVVLWLGWRKPTWVLLIALATLAIRPQLLWGGPAVGYEWGLHQTLIVLALALNALRHGVYRTINWPVLALLAALVLSIALGELHPKLTLPFMLLSLALLALPFAFTQVILAPGSRRAYALLIALAPSISIALGGLLQAAGVRTIFSQEAWAAEVYRLEGATGNAAVFATLAFAGFAIALHEWTRPGRPYAGYLASVNLALVLLSGTRMAILASFTLLATYLWSSATLRAQLRRYRTQALCGGGLLLATALAYLPTLQGRMFHEDQLQLSSRDTLWSFYYDEFLLSPLFGRGLGAGFVASSDWLQVTLPMPHNEYLHMLVVGGVTGFALWLAAVVLWFRHLLQVASPNDREFLIAMIPALGVFAITDNILVYSSALAIYAYFAVILARPSPVARLPEPLPAEAVPVNPRERLPAGARRAVAAGPQAAGALARSIWLRETER